MIITNGLFNTINYITDTFTNPVVKLGKEFMKPMYFKVMCHEN